MRLHAYNDSAAESVASEVSELLSYPEELALSDRGAPASAFGSSAGGGGGPSSPAGAAGATLVDRLDSAHYEPRPPGLLERQDSAHEVRVFRMFLEVFQLDLDRVDSAHYELQPPALLERPDFAHEGRVGDLHLSLVMRVWKECGRKPPGARCCCLMARQAQQ